MEYLVLSLILLAIGFYGLLTKRSLAKILISIELIASAAAINFVYASMVFNATGQAIMILALAVDTSLVAIVIGVALTIHHEQESRLNDPASTIETVEELNNVLSQSEREDEPQ